MSWISLAQLESAMPRGISTIESLWTRFPWTSVSTPDHVAGRFFGHVYI